MGNSFVFPAPKEKTFAERRMEDRLKFLNKPKGNQRESEGMFSFLCCTERKASSRIPYLLFKQQPSSPSKRNHLIIYFHGNSESLSQAYYMLEKFYNIFDVKFKLSPYF